MTQIGNGLTEGLERVLAVMAHPDDVDFGCAGTMATWAAAGVEVTYCIVTNGDAGGSDLELPRPEMARIRQEEQRNAAAAVGVKDVRFLGHPDGSLYVTHDLRRDISRVIRELRPQRVVCQSPERNYMRIYGSHPDHIAAGEAAMSAVYPDARNPFAHPELLREEGLEPWAVEETWIAQGPDADYFMDITDVFEQKVKALQAHVSQTSHMENLREMLHDWAAMNALAAGASEGRLAEAYRVCNTA